MLFPKKVKHRKWQIGRVNPKRISTATRGVTVDFGAYGLKAETYGSVNARQIEAARKVISRAIGKMGKLWIRVFPDRPYTRKAGEVPMGKGKGDPEGFCLYVRPGRVLFEVDGVEEEVASEALRKAGTKLPIKTRIISR